MKKLNMNEFCIKQKKNEWIVWIKRFPISHCSNANLIVNKYKMVEKNLIFKKEFNYYFIHFNIITI